MNSPTSEQCAARRWVVWRTETIPGQLFEERRLYHAFKEYPGQRLSTPVHRRRPLQPAWLEVALFYLADRPDDYEGVAYLREDGGGDYYTVGSGL
jgi:hypothetical protein